MTVLKADKGLTLEPFKFAIVHEDGELNDGAHGLSLGRTEREAWERALDPCEDWSIERAKDYGLMAVQFA